MSMIMPVICTLQIDGNDTVAVKTPFGPTSKMSIDIRFDDLVSGHTAMAEFMRNMQVVPYAGAADNIPDAQSTQELITAHNEVNAFGDSIEDIFVRIEEGCNMLTLPMMINECLLVSLTVKTTGVVAAEEAYDPNADEIKWYLQCKSATGGDTFQIPNGETFLETPEINVYLGVFDTYRELCERVMSETIRVSAPTIELNRAIVNSLQMLRTELMVEVDNYCKVWETDAISIGFGQAIQVADSLLTVTLTSTGGPQVDAQSADDEAFLQSLHQSPVDDSDMEVE